MRSTNSLFRRLWKDESGSISVELALCAAGLAAMAIAIVVVVGGGLTRFLKDFKPDSFKNSGTFGFSGGTPNPD